MRSPQDGLEGREFIQCPGADTPLIAKIEKHEALDHLEEILKVADGLMVAPGDLGVEVPLEGVPFIQKQIIAAAILTSTEFGSTARLISRFRPHTPIIAVTTRRETWRRLCLSWGVFPLLAPHIRDTDEMLRVVKEEALKAGMLRPGQRVIITAGTPIGIRGTTNLIKADTIT